jgi:hypothetical protein
MKKRLKQIPHRYRKEEEEEGSPPVMPPEFGRSTADDQRRQEMAVALFGAKALAR